MPGRRRLRVVEPFHISLVIRRRCALESWEGNWAKENACMCVCVFARAFVCVCVFARTGGTFIAAVAHLLRMVWQRPEGCEPRKWDTEGLLEGCVCVCVYARVCDFVRAVVPPIKKTKNNVISWVRRQATCATVAFALCSGLLMRLHVLHRLQVVHNRTLVVDWNSDTRPKLCDPLNSWDGGLRLDAGSGSHGGVIDSSGGEIPPLDIDGEAQ